MPTSDISVVEVRQGPRGPAGANGTNGTDAEVTQSNMIAALSDKPAWIAAQGINSFYASSYGFSPDATASANVFALQAALDAANTAGGGIVVIDQAGDYAVNATCRIYANTTLVCAPGVALSKSGSNFGEVIANDGIWTGDTDENISIIGLRIKCNGNQLIEAIVPGLRGHMSFWHVRNLTLHQCQILDLPNAQFGIHISDWEDLVVTECRMEGDKDGLHLGKGQRGIVRRLYTDTVDDGLAINAHDWIVSNPDIGEISDLVAEDCHFEGQAIRFMTGSWTAWQTATTYYRGETVNNAGKIYRAFLAAGTSASSSVAPTHTSGTVTGADGIPWRFEREGAETETNIRRVRLVRCTSKGNLLFTDAWNGATDNRAVTPSTSGNSYIGDLTLEDCDIDPATTNSGITGYCRFKDLSIIRTRFGPNTQFPIGLSPDSIPGWASSHTANVTWQGCRFEMTSVSLLLEPKTDALWIHDIADCSAPNDSDGFVGVAGRVVRNDSLVITGTSPAVTAPAAGDRTFIQGFQGQQVFRFGLWEPVEATPLHMLRRVLSPLATEQVNGTATIYSGHAILLSPGTTATGYAMAVFAQYINYAPGAGASFTAPLILTGTITGNVNVNALGRVIVGANNYLGEYPGNQATRFTTPLINRSFGIEVRANGGNQEIRIIAHNGTAGVASDWHVIGALNPSRLTQFRIHSLGTGVIRLYLGSSITGRPANLADTPVCTLASGGPVGNGAAGDQQIVAIQTADGTNAPTYGAWAVDNLVLQLIP